MSANQTGAFLRRVASEPTVHFLLVAVLVFAVYAFTQSSRDKVLEVDARELEARILMQEVSSGQALNAQQRDAIRAAYIEEQILVREALAMELDNDARIHDLLAQKMRHVLSGDIIQPSDNELEAYYQTNLDRYRQRPVISADELVFNQQEALPDEVLAALQAEAEPQAILQLADGNSAPLQNASHLDLVNIFSEPFADRVFAAEPGQWQGPFASNRGQHWLRVTSRRDASIPPLNAIRDRVRLDWIAAEEEVRLQAAVDRLWNQYTIVINGEDSE